MLFVNSATSQSKNLTQMCPLNVFSRCEYFYIQKCMRAHVCVSCEALTCYQCYSETQPDCQDPFSGNSQYIKTCSTLADQKCYVSHLFFVIIIDVICIEIKSSRLSGC